MNPTMQLYQNHSGHSGVTHYEAAERSITVRFQDGGTYLYSYRTPGKRHVEAMKRLAFTGSGLATYINQHVREAYERRLS